MTPHRHTASQQTGQRAPRRGSLCLGVAALALVTAPALRAEPMIGESRGTFGLPGLIDMPTAESRPDGEIGATTYFADGAQRHSFAFQITPRLSGVYRYSSIDDLDPAGGTLLDRSFDFQFQLTEENGMRPAVAVGIRDFIGNGAYSSEYLVATKTLSPGLRATAGLGWGRLGSEGGFSGFGDRPAYDFSGPGGELNSGKWFRGDIAPFFGLAWQATYKLTLKAEYSSDAYEQEVALAGFDHASPVNLGFDYRFSRYAGVSGYYIHGSGAGLQFSVSLDPRRPPFPSGIEKTPLPVRPRPAPGADPEGWSGAWAADPEVLPGVQRAVADALRKDGQVLESMSLSASRAEVRVRNESYGAQAQAMGHTARILTRALPPSVETLVITNVARGMPTSSVTFRRSDIEAFENTSSVDIAQRMTISDAAAGPTEGLRPTEGLFPRFRWSLTQYVDATLFDTDNSLQADIGLKLSGSYEIQPGLIASGSIRQKLAGNLDDATGGTGGSGAVYPVRSDIAAYSSHDDLAIQSLTLAWYGRPAPEVYSRVTVGLLERMYGGVSGEVLWKPVDSRLALGAEVNWVRQRDFDQRFDFRDYDTVTGHASAYYDFGGGFNGQLDVGRYLAEDWGATVALNRDFANGWRVGAFATVTDMSREDFGDGSFDKGIRLTIPIAWTTGKPTVSKLDTTLRPATRDGGARLNVDGRLYDTIQQSHTGAIYDSWGRFWR